MNKELTPFANKVCPKNCIGDCFECDLVEKKLKALEIIKEKGVDVIWVLETKNVEEYNDSLCIYSDLTKEQYDFLKEVLSNV